MGDITSIMTDASREARAYELIGMIGRGLRLRVPHDGSRAALVHDPRGWPVVVNVEPVEPEMVEFLVHIGLLWKMREHRVGDDKSWRTGWREAGMDGDMADWYVSLM